MSDALPPNPATPAAGKPDPLADAASGAASAPTGASSFWAAEADLGSEPNAGSGWTRPAGDGAPGVNSPTALDSAAGPTAVPGISGAPDGPVWTPGDHIVTGPIEGHDAVPLDGAVPFPVAARRGSRRGALLGALGLTLALVVGVAGTVGVLAAAGRLRIDATPAPSVADATPSPAPTPTPHAGPEVGVGSIGLPSAPVTITIWADYQCPYCRLETMAYGAAILREYVETGRASLAYADFAFLGQESVDAAVAAQCAGRQSGGAFWRYHDILFAAQGGENQGNFARQNLIALAKVASLDSTAFTACLDDASVTAAVAASTARGKAAGVKSTPTTIITGPGSTQTLSGFSNSWATISDAFDKAETLAPAGSSAAPSGSAGPNAPGPGSTVSLTPGPSGDAASPSVSSTPAPSASSTR